MRTWTFLSSSKHISQAHRFEHEQIITVYGHTKVNFLQAPLAHGDHILRVLIFGGDVMLQMPDHVGIEIAGTLVYSEVHIETLATGTEEHSGARWTSENFAQARVRVRIELFGMFGGVEILRVPDIVHGATPTLLADDAFSTPSPSSYEGETARLHRNR
ncbi:MAG: LiaF domain-containing protein [Chloroflexota bacterium]